VTAGTFTIDGSDSLAGEGAWWKSVAVFVLPFVVVVGVASASGGFNATSFGWTALAFAWIVIVTVVLTRPMWGFFDAAWLTAAAAMCLYTFFSAAWSGSVGTAVNNGQRSLEYLTAVAAALLLARRGRLSLWLGGLALGAAAVSVYSLATRLFPDRLGVFNANADYRLFVPIGYWNALGIFAAIAALLAFGVVVAGRGRVLSVLTATALVPLTATLYFTFSRGADLGLVFGLGAVFGLSPQRLRMLGGLVVLAPIPAAGVLLASRASALTHQSVAVSTAAPAGHRLALELALLAVAQSVVAAIYVVRLSRASVGEATRRAVGAAAIAVVLVALFTAFAVYGSPPTLVRHAYGSFDSTPTRSTDLNSRLFSLSSNARAVLWRSAFDDFKAHPVVGSGAGGFGRWWLAHRSTVLFVEDAHNLYLQTLAEGGIIGATLLGAFLGLPLIAAIRARRHPLVAPAFGAYAAFLVHAGVDWDWQVPAVTLLALFAGAAIIAAARAGQSDQGPRVLWRLTIGGLSALAVAVAFVGLIGNIALAKAERGVLNGFDREATIDAEKAHRWAPWSSEPLRALGESRILAGHTRAGLLALRQSAAKDPGDWLAWYDIAVVTSGAEHRLALSRARALNPLGPELVTVVRAR
jgi:O-Antigen ligase